MSSSPEIKNVTITQLLKQLDLCDKSIAKLDKQIAQLDAEILALRSEPKILK